MDVALAPPFDVQNWVSFASVAGFLLALIQLVLYLADRQSPKPVPKKAAWGKRRQQRRRLRLAAAGLAVAVVAAVDIETPPLVCPKRVPQGRFCAVGEWAVARMRRGNCPPPKTRNVRRWACDVVVCVHNASDDDESAGDLSFTLRIPGLNLEFEPLKVHGAAFIRIPPHDTRCGTLTFLLGSTAPVVDNDLIVEAHGDDSMPATFELHMRTRARSAHRNSRPDRGRHQGRPRPPRAQPEPDTDVDSGDGLTIHWETPPDDEPHTSVRTRRREGRSPVRMRIDGRDEVGPAAPQR